MIRSNDLYYLIPKTFSPSSLITSSFPPQTQPGHLLLSLSSKHLYHHPPPTTTVTTETLNLAIHAPTVGEKPPTTTVTVEIAEKPSKLWAGQSARKLGRCSLRTEKQGQVRAGVANNWEKHCRTSQVVVEKLAGYIDTDKCVKACGVDRDAVGISSDAFLEPHFLKNMCTANCYEKCPNLVELYFNLAAGEGVFLPYLCERQRSEPHRDMRESSSSRAASGPASEQVEEVDGIMAPAPASEQVEEVDGAMPPRPASKQVEEVDDVMSPAPASEQVEEEDGAMAPAPASEQVGEEVDDTMAPGPVSGDQSGKLFEALAYAPLD
uniref:uncharacterized protein LOC105352623 n=1 Tax=Fragaria vesca subsp. vesca TaxID=101020 RepID=UPI0005C8610B|nr:PREDICTED: uncharacterized protein LOC105352623 [Fragaria vesca subsp. vesca]